MQALVDIVGGITGSIQKIIFFFILAGIVISGIVMLGVSSTAPVVADQFGERAERISEKAIEAAREEHRAAEMGKDGWGYSDSGTRAGSGTSRNAEGERVGGWGTE